MDTSLINSTDATPTPTTTPPQANAKISSDFETFLRMLTVQMKNQDPLNPTEASDFAVQLATFSGVEQQVRTNDLLERMAGQWAGNDLSQMSVWIGKDVRVSGAVTFEGNPLSITPSPVSYADTAFLRVRDAAGNEVHRISIPLSGEPVEWSGRDHEGNAFPHGQYSFDVLSFANGELLQETPADVYARVVELRKQDQETVLILAGGASVPTSSVTALRDPRQP